MESSAPPSPTTPKSAKSTISTYKQGVLTYGCDHIRKSITGTNSSFVDNYKRALVTICNPNSVRAQVYKNEKSKLVARLGPLYLCLQCDNTVPKELIDKHSLETKHRICKCVVFVESRNGHVFCNMCKDFVFDPTLETLRTRKVDAGSGAPTRKRKPEGHVELFQENTIREANRESSKQTCNTTSVRGIWNMGSTCYMAVILESLVHNPLIRNFYLSEGHKPSTCQKSLNGEPCLSCNMDDMFQQFNNTESTTAFSAQNILGSFMSSTKPAYAGLVPNEQQDAHEFLNYLLEELHEISSSTPLSAPAEGSLVKKVKLDGDDCSCVIHQTFYGKTLNIIRCKGIKDGKRCGQVIKSSPQQFSDLSLGLDFLSNQSSAKKPHSLEYCLKKEYFTEEQCDYNCSTCGNKKATKQVSIETLPNVLCIQLKRFTQKESGAVKIKKKVSFPLKLEMLPYTVKSDVAKGNGKVRHTLKARSTYHLQSVVTHIGDAIEQGHYISYSKHENQWFKFDDHKVYLAQKSEVLGAEAYILFYVIQSLATTEEKKA